MLYSLPFIQMAKQWPTEMVNLFIVHLTFSKSGCQLPLPLIFSQRPFCSIVWSKLLGCIKTQVDLTGSVSTQASLQLWHGALRASSFQKSRLVQSASNKVEVACGTQRIIPPHSLIQSAVTLKLYTSDKVELIHLQ